MQIFTVGHSNHSVEKFLNLLKRNRVSAIADVRSSPFSRRLPHFNQSSLRKSLASEGVSYAFLGEELGARSKNPECYVEGKARYELIAATEEFALGLDRILKGVKHHQVALMCAEQDPITCHRAILVCKHLKDAGLDIQHILKTGELESHEHLEQRLLKLHGLSDSLPLLETSVTSDEPEAQLQLFNTGVFDTNSDKNNSVIKHSLREDVIEQAYRLQGEQIAYVERYNNSDNPHERAS
jgi:uncharacterized protein (DUF488 family)